MWIKRLFIFSLGLFFSLATLELGLGISSYLKLTSKKVSNSSKKILCLGNSFTYGVGAEPEKSYPVQLQSIFQKNNLTNVQVINGGQANINTRFQLNHLEENIENYQPELIILQTGEPNKWNHFGFREYLDGRTKNEWSFFTDTHIGKLVKYLHKGPHRKEFSAAEVEYPLHRYRNEYWEAITWSQYVRSNATFRTKTNDELAKKHIKWLKRGILFHRASPQSYASLGLIEYYYFKNYKNAFSWAIEALKINPFVYDMTDANALMRTLQSDPNPMTSAILKQFEINYPQFFKNFITENDSRIWDWASSDLEKMIQIIKKRKIKLLLLDYPPAPSFPLAKRPIDEVIYQTAKKHNIPFLSIYDIFHFRSGTPNFFKEHYWEKFEALDEHLNGQGYNLMAQQIFSYLEKNKMLLQ